MQEKRLIWVKGTVGEQGTMPTNYDQKIANRTINQEGNFAAC